MTTETNPLDIPSVGEQIEINRTINERISESRMSKAFLTSDNQTWATPWQVIRALEDEGFNFVLDIASGMTTSKAKKFYTQEDDAFRQDILKDSEGGDIWCNPPYGDPERPVKDWVLLLCSIRLQKRSVLLLPSNKTDQDWYHDLAIPYAEIRPVRGRIGFLDGNGKPVSGNSQGSMLIIFGPGIIPCAPRSFDWKLIKKKYAGMDGLDWRKG